MLSFESARGLSVREALLRLAAPLGRLRWFSREHGWDLVFRKTRRDKFVYLPYGDFIDERTWELDEGAMITTAKNFSERHRLDTAEVAARMQAAPPADPWQLCNGHDLCGILAVGLCRVLGSCRSAVKLSGDDVQDALLLAYEREHLAATEMFASLRQWEARRAPHRVL